ncbi:hypothetical protein CW696_06270 [ANME-2 cluster archaeon]|nr:MAG: hypothetical protein CW696_06270 [ANME-2 cluster archaeon]
MMLSCLKKIFATQSLHRFIYQMKRRKYINALRRVFLKNKRRAALRKKRARKKKKRNAAH